jgi:hypothetical protein
LPAGAVCDHSTKEVEMPLFGIKPNKMYVFIHYWNDPPTNSQQTEIMNSLAKGNPTLVFAGASRFPEEQREAPLPLREAFLKLQGSKHFYTNGIGTGSTPEYRIREMGGFVVTTVKGKFT